MHLRSGLLFLLFPLACSRPQPSPAGSPQAGEARPSAPSVTADARAGADDLADAERRRLVEQVGRELEAHYVFPDVAARMASAIRERAAHGAYDGVRTATDLARVVTADMRDVSHDRHAMLEHTPPPEQASADEAEWTRLQEKNRATAGFGATERLPGNVARVEIHSFESGDDVRAAVTRHLSEIADADALILDVRECSGGDPATVAFVASYVFNPPKVHLNDMFWHDTQGTEAYWTTPDVAGKRFGGSKPLFVLTSKHTFSAGEELAYDLQSLHRAQIVGEASAGGAHPVDIEKLSPLLTLRIPTGRAINPVTKSDWEGTGVKPEVDTDAASAVHAAHLRALRAIVATPHLPETKRRDAQAALAAMSDGR